MTLTLEWFLPGQYYWTYSILRILRNFNGGALFIGLWFYSRASDALVVFSVKRFIWRTGESYKILIFWTTCRCHWVMAAILIVQIYVYRLSPPLLVLRLVAGEFFSFSIDYFRLICKWGPLFEPSFYLVSRTIQFRMNGHSCMLFSREVYSRQLICIDFVIILDLYSLRGPVIFTANGALADCIYDLLYFIANV